ncbi:MAG: hypothetical protein ACKV2U_01455 [Bryobacteraceae bacterium]
MWKKLAMILTLGLQIGPAAESNDWSRVAGLRAGTPVEVIHGSMKRAAGTVTEANDSGIGIETRNGTVSILRAETKRVTITTHSRKKRALIGMAIGAGAGAAAMTIAAKTADIDLRHDWIAAAGAVLGGAAGAGVGALTGGPVTIYRAP